MIFYSLNTLKQLFILLMTLMSWQIHAAPDARILYINSYHPGYFWSDTLQQGLTEELNKLPLELDISVEYLDSRRFDLSKQKDFIATSFATKYKQFRPDVIIVSDNAAFDFVAEYRHLFPRQPIVFTGFNYFRPEKLNGLNNITGVNEEISFQETIDLALHIHPNIENIAFILSTNDLSSKLIAETIEKQYINTLKKNYQVAVLKNLTLDKIEHELQQLNKNTLVFLAGQATDKFHGRELSPIENAEYITKLSPHPVYSFWQFHLNHGVVGGSVLTGRDQGIAAGKLATKIILGSNPKDIPVIMKTPSSRIFDFNILQKFAIPVERLPEDSKVINQPSSIWDEYYWELIGITTSITLQSILIILLVYLYKSRKKAMLDLSVQQAKLEDLITERTLELSLANQQLTKLSQTDDITQLGNRRYFNETLENEFRRFKRSDYPLSLIMLGIDRFTSLNEEQGSAMGDNCLQTIAQLINDSILRTPDFAARYAGEEFAIILPETDYRGAAKVANRIHEKVYCHAHQQKITVSIGVITTLPDEISHSAELVSLATNMLTKAKKMGAGQICQIDLSHTDDLANLSETD